jgi:glutaredoxin
VTATFPTELEIGAFSEEVLAAPCLFSDDGTGAALENTMRVHKQHLFGTLVLIITMILSIGVPVHVSADPQSTSVYVFWQVGCPHCAGARAALEDIVADSADVLIVEIEVGSSSENDAVFVETANVLDIPRPAVPLVVVGGDYEIGFRGGGISEERYRQMIARCADAPCAHPVGAIISGQSVSEPLPDVSTDLGRLRVNLPWIGEVDAGELSLPLMTVVLAGVDGFNPCAMWVLALLIGLLLNVQESRRMWLLGGVFLIATGAMYFAVMAAWLNVVLWLGAVHWIRSTIGILAIAAGFYYLREYWANPEGVCRITPSGRRRSVAEAFRSMVEQPNLAVAAIGVAALAITVNLVELACSAGLPAIYTQALAMHDLEPHAYYGYLLLYISVFLLDDTVLFVVAMVTLRAAVTTGRYSRYSHLVGGVVLLVLGTIMVLRPDLLA